MERRGLVSSVSNNGKKKKNLSYMELKINSLTGKKSESKAGNKNCEKKIQDERVDYVLQGTVRGGKKTYFKRRINSLTDKTINNIKTGNKSCKTRYM